MDAVVDLVEWRRQRLAAAETGEEPAQDAAALERLERAVDRLHALVGPGLDHGERLEPRVETELLAIMGELSVGMVDRATSRAERLAQRLATRKGVR